MALVRTDIYLVKVPTARSYSAAIEYILSCQKRNGLIALVAPEGIEIPRDVPLEVGSTAVYNHALSR